MTKNYFQQQINLAQILGYDQLANDYLKLYFRMFPEDERLLQRNENS